MSEKINLKKQKRKIYEDKNREQIRVNHRKPALDYYYRHREKISEKRRLNKEKINQATKNWAKKNPERRREIANAYYHRNKDKSAQYRKEYTKRNRDKITKRVREFYNANPSAKIMQRLRHRINQAVLRGSNKRSSSLLILLGVETKEKLILHLESQFTVGMTWENYGKMGWHIDHIVPCTLFDLSKEWEQKSCFNYKNLQPLWSSDNIRKSNKLEVCPI